MRHLIKGVGNTLFNVTKHVVQKADSFFDPRIGHHLIKHQAPQYLLHLSAHPVEIINERGFPARLPETDIAGITRTRLDDYQSLNANKFALGACSSYPDLAEGFIAGNPSLAKDRILYAFYARAVDITLFRADHLGEANERDYEREHLVLEDVPSTSILVATGPEYRQKFEDGLLVPNEMADFDSRLPKSFKIKDIEKLSTVIAWLLEHDCTETAQTLCSSMFNQKSEQYIRYHLNDDQRLIDFARSSLSPKLTF